MILLLKKNDFERLIGDLFNHLRRLHCFMKTDKIFVLLLVVLLPMTGCFDDAVGDAEGTDEPVNNDNVSTTNLVTTPSVMTVHIAEGQTETIILNGTTLMLNDMWYVDEYDSWRNGYPGSLSFSMNCANGFSMSSSIYYSTVTFDDPYLPNLPGIECEITLNSASSTERILIFTEANLSELTTISVE